MDVITRHDVVLWQPRLHDLQGTEQLQEARVCLSKPGFFQVCIYHPRIYSCIITIFTLNFAKKYS
jgi:hypothetical protein